MSATDGWTARIHVAQPDRAAIARLRSALAPEAEREVPRARAEIVPAGPDGIEIVVHAEDTGALRAALNTYLGWLRLIAETERRAGGLT